jgi:hypothetical protein
LHRTNRPYPGNVRPFFCGICRHLIACARICVRQARRTVKDTSSRSEQSRRTMADASRLVRARSGGDSLESFMRRYFEPPKAGLGA